MRFIDLFCGIGGFHHALHDLGHNCVLAADIDEDCRQVYKKNWGISPLNDVNDVVGMKLKYDILCAGWPCQPFSKSGSQLGFMDETRGTLFHTILEIIGEKGGQNQPKVVFLENVPNLLSHDGGNTYEVIEEALKRLDYRVYKNILSPHEFNIPQHRPRVFIIGLLKDRKKVKHWDKFEWPKIGKYEVDVNIIKEKKATGQIPEQVVKAAKLWTKFLQRIPNEVKPPSPTWSMEFGRSYQLDKIHPLNQRTKQELISILDKEGIMVKKWYDKKRILALFPPYVRNIKSTIPKWKKGFIEKNRNFWILQKKLITEEWLLEIRKLQETHQKLEWHVGDGERDVLSHMIHSRPSGLRVSRMNWIPALVAMAQTPIIGPWGRHLTVEEAANAQSFSVNFERHSNEATAFKQMGNSVNVKVVSEIMKCISKCMIV